MGVDRIVSKGLVVGIILLFVASNFVSGLNIQLKNTTIPLITGRGNTLYVGGTGEGNYSKIQDAINNTTDGDTVFVYDDSSPYYENVVINKSINLIGENRENTVIDGNGDDVAISLIKMAFVEKVVLSGFTIQNAKTGIGYDTGINNLNIHSFLLNRDYNSSAYIYNNTMINNDFGIVVGWWSDDVALYRNKISNNKKGIALGYCFHGNNAIFENIIVDNDYGICLDCSNYNEITRNIIINNTNGINLLYSEGNSIRDNQVKYNYLSVYLLNSDYNYIENNVITENIDGIYLEKSSLNYIHRNTFKNNQNAISLKLFSKYNRINSNDIKNNSIKGLLLEHFCDKNTIDKNNFIKNDIHAFYINSFKNSWDENYWDNWIGLRGGIWLWMPEIIFGRYGPIPWPNFDWHPAKEPYDIGV